MKKLTLILLALALSVLCIQTVLASGGSMFILGSGATPVDQAGTWGCGYVVNGSPGTHTYTLQITATNGANFPLSDVHIVVLISDAAHAGGLTQIVLSCSKTASDTLTTSSPDDFTAGTFNYGANGGPFTLSDYYGYNREYVIPSLSQAEADKNLSSGYQLKAEITFASTANTDSKVFFLVYGTDSSGNVIKAPFSGGTLFVVPEYFAGGLIATAACMGAFAVFYARRKPKLR